MTEPTNAPRTPRRRRSPRVHPDLRRRRRAPRPRRPAAHPLRPRRSRAGLRRDPEAARRDGQDDAGVDRAADRSPPRTGIIRRARSTWPSCCARQAFRRVELVPTKGKPGVFGTLDAGAKNWLAIYFMYDVKQYDPAEWSSPPLEGRLVDKPGVGKVIIGRGATNSKGPQSVLPRRAPRLQGRRQEAAGEPRARLRGRRGDRRRRTSTRSSSSPRWSRAAEVRKASSFRCGNQTLDGSLEMNLGAKGVVELELVSSGEKWGRGPKLDVHSSYEAQRRQPGVASRAGAQHARRGRRSHARRRRILRQGPAAHPPS